MIPSRPRGRGARIFPPQVLGSGLSLALATLSFAMVASGCGGESAPAESADSASTAADVSGDATGSGADSQQQDSGSASGTDAGSTITCHPVNNTGCPADQHCIWEGNKLTCVANGEHAAGQECTDGKGCKIGLCVSVQGTDKSVCSPHCLANLECASGICNKLQNSKGKVCDMGVQVAQCNPLAPNCDAGQSCYGGGNGFVCMASGKVEAGQVCPDDNSCAPGLACVGKAGSGNGVCRKLCKIGGGAPACDDISSTCSSLLGSSTVGTCDG